jgi:hypothetical protein
MYAILRQYTFDIAKIAHAEEALTVAQGLHAAQPSYADGIVAADGQRFIAVNLWRTEDDASAARGTIGAQVQRLLKPPMTAPSQLLTADEVVASDLGSPSITQATTMSADDDNEHHDHS